MLDADSALARLLRVRSAVAVSVLLFVAILALVAFPVANAQTRVGILYLDQDEYYGWTEAAMIWWDTAYTPPHGYAYFVTNYHHQNDDEPHSSLVKIDLETFTRVATLLLPKLIYYARASTAALDAANGIAYIAVGSEIVKVRLHEFTVAGQLDLYPQTGARTLSVAVIQGGHAFFGTSYPGDDSPAIIVKIRLSDFKSVGVLTLNPGENHLTAATLDPWMSYGYGYFAAYRSYLVPPYGPAKIVKVDLSALTRVGALTLNEDEGAALTVATDHLGFSYWGTAGTPGTPRVIMTRDLTRYGELALSSDENSVESAVIHNGFAYFGTSSGGPDMVTKIVKVRIYIYDSSLPPSPPTRVDALTLEYEKFWSGASTAVADPGSDVAYFGGGLDPGFVLKIGLASGGLNQVSTTILNAPANTIYFARTGNMYDDSALGYIYMACSNRPQNIIAQNDPTKVDQATGRPLFGGDMVVFGGYAASKIVNYFEITLGYTLISITYDESYFRFMRGSTVVYEIPRSSYDYNKADYFVVQIYSDFSSAQPRTVVSMWGIAHTGTYASGVYFADYIYPNLASLTEGYYVCKWTDLNNDGIQQSNEITIVASGS